MIIGSNQVMEKSNLTSKFDNHDYDGDSLGVFALHSNQAKEDFQYAYVKNLTEFEHLDELLIDYEHESIYSSYMLTLKASENLIKLEEDSELNREFKMIDFKEKPGLTQNYPELNAELTIVEAAINHSLLTPLKDKLIEMGRYTPIYIIEETGVLTKKNLSKLTLNFWNLINEINKFYDKEVVNFWDGIHELDKFFLETSAVIGYCTPSFDLQDFVVASPEISKFKENLIKEEPFIAFHQNMVLFEKISEEIGKQPDNILNLVFNSGARLKSVQLLKAASNTGIPTDIYGKAFGENIENSLLDGLSPIEYFVTGDSARLALAQRQEAIPKGGELQRKFFFTVGILKLDREVSDCGTTKYFDMLVKNKSHLELLNHRWFVNPKTNQEEIIDISDESLVGQTIQIRSPITCQHTNYRICGKCLGDKHPSSVNLGSLVGAALSEGIIQSVLRAHHFGGAFIANEDKELMNIMRRSTFRAPDTIINDSQKDIDYITEYLSRIYPEEDIQLTQEPEVDGTIHLTIKVNELPFNDDSVKVLNRIVGLIDRNRKESALIQPSDLYDQLEIVIEQNGILSSYLELIISLLYYDEDQVLYRYSEKPPVQQVALKNIVELLDPKLSIFYNFSNRIISKIYNHEKKAGAEEIDHMYHDLISCYH